jgi:hypothetical protein
MMTNMTNNAKKFKLPHTFVLLFIILALIAAATWLVPGGKYDTHLVNGKQLINPDSFHYIERAAGTGGADEGADQGLRRSGADHRLRADCRRRLRGAAKDRGDRLDDQVAGARA